VHCPIVDPARPLLIHHARQTGDAFLMRVVRDGATALESPETEVFIADMHGAPAGLRLS
jgi:hypothetical protein